MTAEEMAALQKALYSATKVAKSMKVPTCHRVENEDGLAVFYGESGNVLGAMNWEDYEAVRKERGL